MALIAHDLGETVMSLLIAGYFFWYKYSRFEYIYI